ncbi:right-handed parallel beta-helix repeat-containing protein [Methanobrevibacter filiformis]|uniref:Uncharacterized protein n=1 Tax=Methanobrevibacter filiformis TaxID=55758 RepID=A0A166FCW9_9EURY|nr:right-handed parallel beta-helix repeat-containing protein [Methanobrevibacter filiformis]KZX17548.1 hypothetical protein MBFIL_01060 [Methanobrevibacter filiformis]
MLIAIVSSSAVSAADTFKEVQDKIDNTNNKTVDLGNKTYVRGDFADSIVVKSNNLLITGKSDKEKATLDSKELGGIFQIDGQNVTLRYLILTNADVSGFGSAIYDNGAKLTVKNCVIKNSKSRGGAIFVQDTGSNAQIIGSSFINNQAIYAGSSCGQKSGGAAIDSRAQNTQIINSNFTNNRASVDSGAVVFYGNSANNQITGSIFINNTGVKGGAIGTYGSVNSLNIKSSVFSRNKATTGGAIYLTGKGNIESSTFQNNTGANGGAAYLEGVIVIKNNTQFKYNKADNGSAIYTVKALKLYKTTFSANKAKLYTVIASLNGGTVNKKGDAIVTVKLTTGNNGLNAVYAKSSLYLDNKIIEKNTSPAKEKTLITLKTKKYQLKSNSKGIASVKITNFNVKGTNNLNVVYNDSAIYNKLSNTTKVIISQKTTKSLQFDEKTYDVKEFVISNYLTGRGSIKNVKHLIIKSYSVKELVTSTKINGVIKSESETSRIHVETIKQNYPGNIKAPKGVYCSCGRIGYGAGKKQVVFVNKCPFTHSKKSSKLIWNPKGVHHQEGEWTCSGCGADFCAVSGYEKISGSKRHLRKT